MYPWSLVDGCWMRTYSKTRNIEHCRKAEVCINDK